MIVPLVLALAATASAHPVYVRLANSEIRSDIPLHARLVEQVMATAHPFSYSAWYPFMSFVTGGSTDFDVILGASTYVLTAMTTVKVLLCYAVALRLTRSIVGSAAVAVLVFAAMPLLNPFDPTDIYLGQITPNVWHNSTLIFALPFAIAAFLAATAFCMRATWTRAAILGPLLLLSTLAKPNFTLVLGLVAGLFVMTRLFRGRRGLLESLGLLAVAFLPSVALLGYQYFATYLSDGIVRSTLVFAPFATWSEFSSNIPLSVVLSLLGPALTLLAVGKERRRHPLFVVAWGALAVGIVQLSLLGELWPGGALATHGNHFWGAYSAAFMVFLVSGIALVSEVSELTHEGRAGTGSPGDARPPVARKVKVYAAVLVMVLHVATGIFYISGIATGHLTAF